MNSPLSARNLDIYRRAVLENQTTEQLAVDYGVTAPRISQIIHRVGQAKHGRKLKLAELRELEVAVGQQDAAADTVGR